MASCDDMATDPTSRSRLLFGICAVTAIYWLVLFVATHIPMQGRSPRAPIKDLDKGEHALAFAGLSFLLCATGAALGLGPLRALTLVLIIVACYGAIDEVTQLLVPSRSADWRDWLADITGAICGIMAFRLASSLAPAWNKGPAAAKANG